MERAAPWAVLSLVGEAPGEAWTPRQVAVAVVVGVWAVRLTANWARDWPGLHHEDWRYAKLYAEWPLPRPLTMILGVQVFPTVVVWLGCLPLFPALVLGGGRLGPLDGLALVVGLTASVLELVADEQMRAFRRRARSGEVMDRGLWRWSRHPNYFGEILFWVSLWLFALAAAPGWWWTGVGALAMVLMFVLASVPMLDERSRQRRPGFAAYAARTPALIPRPPRRAG